MNKYRATFLFYLISAAMVYGLHICSPDAHDGGPGFGSLLLVLVMILILVLFFVNIFLGFRRNGSYFIIAGIHLAVFIAGLYTFFI